MRKLFPIFILLMLACVSCGKNEPPKSALSVVVSIMPQKYFVDQISGGKIPVAVLVSPGKSPHNYEPSPRQMSEIARAKVLFITGMAFEKRISEKLAGTIPTLKIVNTADGIGLRKNIEELDEPEEALDPHTWLSPQLARVHAKNIAKVLAEIDPANAAEYQANLEALDKKLIDLDANLKETLAPLKGKTFFVYHPAFGYFADAYGLKQAAVETGGHEPGPREIAELVRRAKQEGVKVIFVQPQFSPRAAENIAREIGGAVVPMDDLAYDYISNLEDMAEKVKAALAGVGATK